MKKQAWTGKACLDHSRSRTSGPDQVGALHLGSHSVQDFHKQINSASYFALNESALHGS